MTIASQPPGLTTEQQRVVDIARTGMAGDGLEALFLTGSLARGRGDRFSDVDLTAVVTPGKETTVVTRWLELADQEFRPVLVKQAERPFTIVNLIDPDWLRIDLVLHPSHRPLPFSKADCWPLSDGRRLWAALPAHPTADGTSARMVEPIVTEFFRIVGLLAVVVGRGEVAVGVTGAGLLRQQVIALMVEEVRTGDPGGALHLNKLLDSEQLADLAALPPLVARIDSVVEFHRACAAVFLRRARPLAARVGARWPDTFEHATLAALARAGVSIRSEIGGGDR